MRSHSRRKPSTVIVKRVFWYWVACTWHARQTRTARKQGYMREAQPWKCRHSPRNANRPKNHTVQVELKVRMCELRMEDMRHGINCTIKVHGKCNRKRKHHQCLDNATTTGSEWNWNIWKQRDYYVKLDAVFILRFSPWHHTKVHVPAGVDMMALVHNEFFW